MHAGQRGACAVSRGQGIHGLQADGTTVVEMALLRVVCWRRLLRRRGTECLRTRSDGGHHVALFGGRSPTRLCVALRLRSAYSKTFFRGERNGGNEIEIAFGVWVVSLTDCAYGIGGLPAHTAGTVSARQIERKQAGPVGHQRELEFLRHFSQKDT